jgi:Putative lactococcus lactis phage r1t holin
MFSKVWLLSTGERLVKTFFQGYLAYFLLASGLGNTPATVGSSDVFNLLFTMDNVKAGAVAAVLSFLTSIASTPVGPDKESPSTVVTENPPTVAGDGAS